MAYLRGLRPLEDLRLSAYFKRKKLPVEKTIGRRKGSEE